MAAAEAGRGAYAPDFKDGAGFGPETQPRLSSGRGPVILAVGAAVILAFGAVVWSAYNQGVRKGGRDAPPLIPAPSSPIKTKPEATLGSAVADTDRTVYRDRVERAPPPASSAADIAEPTEADYGEPLPDLDAAETVDVAAEPVAIDGETSSGASPDAASLGQAVREGPQTLAIAPLETTIDEPDPNPSVGLTPAEPRAEPVEVAAIANPPVTARGATGAFVVQVAALRTRDQALQEWRELTKKHTSLLTGRSADIITVDDTTGGAWHRLRVAAFDSRDDAARFCDKLQAAGQSCLVSKR